VTNSVLAASLLGNQVEYLTTEIWREIMEYFSRKVGLNYVREARC
jgi:hypothetical protein